MRGLRSSRAALDLAAFGPAPIGTPGPDVLAATAPGQTLRGLGGDDRLFSAFNATTLLGGSGADRLRSTVAVTAPQEGAAALAIVQHGGSGNDRLTVDAQARADFGAAALSLRVDGGLGDDRITLNATLGGAFATVALEAQVFGGAGNDRITANVTADAALGVAAPLRLRGGLGDDVIEASFHSRDQNGHDQGLARLRIHGDAGDDRISAFARAGANGSATAENWVDGGTGDDVIDAATFCLSNNSRAFQSNLLYGRDGDDILRASHDGRSNAPQLTNLLDGGAGDDLLRVVQETDGAQADIESLRLDNDLRGGSGADALEAVVSLEGLAFVEVTNRLAGGSGDDVLSARVTGSPGASGHVARNLLWGGGGSDRLEAVGGTETRLEGGSGSDVFVLDPEAALPLTVTLGDFDGAADVLEFRGLTDLGAPGLVDDLDAITTFAYEASGVLAAQIGTLRLRVAGAPAGVDSFADLVADPARQLVAGPDAIL